MFRNKNTQHNTITKKKKIQPYQILLGVCIILFIFFISIIDVSHANQAIEGYFSTSSIDNTSPVALNGEWEYYDNLFLFPSDFTSGITEDITPSYISLPGNSLSTYGYGTYRLTFSFISTNELFSLRIADIQGAARIYVDGELISDVGFTSTLQEISESAKDNQYIVFPLDTLKRSHEIIIQVSNYTTYQSGITSPIYFGTQLEGYRLSSYFKFVESLGFMSVCVLAIFLIFLLIFKIQINNVLNLLFFTIIFVFHLVYSGNDLITQPVFSWPYIALSRCHIISFGVLGFLLLLLSTNNYSPTKFHYKLLKLQRILFVTLVVITLISQYSYLPTINTIVMAYFSIVYIHAFYIGFQKVVHGSYSALLQLLAQMFFGSYLLLQLLNSNGLIYYTSYAYGYIIIIIAFVATQLGYVALHIARIYTGNTRLAQHMISSDKLKEEFISATSHELRTPLHGIINIIAASKKHAINSPDLEEELNLAMRLAQRMNSVIYDLYGFYSTSEQISTSLKPVNLESEVNAIIEMFHYTSSNNKLILRKDLSYDSHWVLANESWLWEVLNNVVGNAIKYTNVGSITIRSRIEHKKVYISIIDTGVGIPANDINLIFNKSKRLKSTSNMADGIGYGLYLTKQLIEQMNGTIEVEWSTPNQGTCFTITLDTCDPPNKTTSTDSNHYNSMANDCAVENYLEITHSHDTALLVVDDNEDNLKIVETIFDDCKFKLDCVQSATKALELLKKHSYDIIISDVMMPEISGFELCQLVRKQYSHFELPILLLTARTSTESILTGFWSGANDYVVKPADRVELRTRVFSLITLKQSVVSTLKNEMLFLQSQIRPHFLYNAFNTISSIALTDGPHASELIDDLSHYLRGCFSKEATQDLINLRTELNIVEAYIRIEKARFGERLNFVSTISSTDGILIPPLTIQPLVENAIRHATMDSYKAISVHLDSYSDNDFSYITINDNGKGIEPMILTSILNDCTDDKSSGIGLSNVNRRLKLQYGIPLSIESTINTGTLITIKIPNNLKTKE